jgi:hypothetical protein
MGLLKTYVNNCFTSSRLPAPPAWNHTAMDL